MRPPPGPRASVLAAAGIVILLAVVTLYEIVATKRAGDQLSEVERTRQLATAYEGAEVAVTQLELSVWQLVNGLNPKASETLPAYIDAALANANLVKEIGDETDRTFVDDLVESYLGQADLLKQAALAGVDFTTLVSQLGDPADVAQIPAALAERAADRRVKADEAMASYQHGEDTRLLVTVLLNGVGFALVVLLVLGLRVYSGREASLIAMRKGQRELELARDEANRANQAKSQFLSRMSHELRTPMNAVLGFGQLLEMDDLTETQRENVAFIMRSGRHLLRLIDEVLDISRIEAGRLSLSLEPFCITDVVRDVVAMSAPMAASHSITIDYRDPSRAEDWRVIGDVQRTKQVLLNLVSNAIKYNVAGGSVHISSEELDSGEVRLSVRDTGHGITPEGVERLFNPFERLGADASNIEGAGLGLALSQALVKAMNGRLDVETAPGAGSTFSMVLPAAHATTAAPADVAEFRECLAHLTNVVCVEDNLASYQVILGVLRMLGIESRQAVSAGEAGQAVRETHPGAVLIDLHLEDGNGGTVVRNLRADPETSTLPIIVTSADVTPATRRKVLAMGADAFLPKPIDIRQLLETLAAVTAPAGRADRAA